MNSLVPVDLVEARPRDSLQNENKALAPQTRAERIAEHFHEQLPGQVYKAGVFER